MIYAHFTKVFSEIVVFLYYMLLEIILIEVEWYHKCVTYQN
jgi:hypothetical protein